ncbi:MAG TPA: bifunctional 4-hydroxy-2-oxoglutarate aldolase/2-dehydro-3-deoxy-phosphogluconate aldolase, partial [Planctomycetaceae bacterium]|nr:bifunctional 4-hydroxy-2-oxoglutarate aldolase/2-dehydro-3-deoxy-phosphogluconate aldolase [Planctomycetaceae bacterium]
ENMTLQLSDLQQERFHRTGLISVMIVDDPSCAVQLAKSLLDGGVDIMELTLRTPKALECLSAIVKQVPEMLAGAGTILFPEHVDQVVAAGAAFGVAPGTNPAVIRRADQLNLPFAPGVATPTDIDLAVQSGCRLLKFFPAEQSGGLNMLASIKAPYAHLGLQYIPLGGVTTDNLSAWLTDPDVLAVGGSWLAKKEAIESARWDEITQTSREARDIVNRVRGNARK